MIAAAGIKTISPNDGFAVPVRQIGFATVRRRVKKWPAGPTAILMTAVVIGSAIPARQSDPMIWSAWAVIIGLTATLIAGSLLETLHRAPHIIRLALLIALCLACVPLLQALPIANVLTILRPSEAPISIALANISIAPAASMIAAVRLISYLLFFLIMLRIGRNSRRAHAVAKILFFGVAAHAFYAMAALNLFGDAALFGPKTAYFGVATGSYVSRSAFAGFLGMGLVTGLALMTGTRRTRNRSTWKLLRRSLNGLALLVILIALISTQSRLGVASTFIAAIAVILPRKSGRVAAVLALGFGLLLGVAYFGTGLLDRLAQLGDSASVRYDFYQQIGTMIGQRPLVGFGLDNFALAFEQFHAPPVSAGFVWDRAHSTYLTLWTEAGLIAGSLPPLAALLCLFALARRRPDRDQLSPVRCAAIGALVLSGLHALFDFSAELPPNMFLLLALVGLGLGAHPSLKRHT